jgi:hypothetical protein
LRGDDRSAQDARREDGDAARQTKESSRPRRAR